MAADNTPNKHEVSIEAAGDVALEGVAIGDRNKIIQQVQEIHGHVVQADQSQVHIGDVYIYFEIPQTEALEKDPYKFLSGYGIDDEHIFFGRDARSQELASQIHSHKLIVLHGNSGSGKSSLVYAGVTPRLIRNNYLVTHITDYRSTAVDILQKTLQQDLESSLVIFLDQFERFFDEKNLSAREQQQFFDVLKTWLDDSALAVHVVIVIRRDFLGELTKFKSIIPSILHETFELEPLSREEAKDAIRMPLKTLKKGIVFDPEFIEILLDALMEEQEIEPAQLQIVCDFLYRKAEKHDLDIISETIYEHESAEGKEKQERTDRVKRLVKELLSSYLQKKLDEYPPDDAEMMKNILKQMINPEPVYNRSLKKFVESSSLAEAIHVPEARLETLLNQLIIDRLVEPKKGERSYSITHEYLADTVNTWYDVDELELKKIRELFSRNVADWRYYHSLIPRRQFKEIRKFKDRLEFEPDSRKLFRLSSVRYYAVSVMSVASLILSVIIGTLFLIQAYHQFYLIPRDIGRFRVEAVTGAHHQDTGMSIFLIDKTRKKKAVYRAQKLPSTLKLAKGIYSVEIPVGTFVAKYIVAFEGYAHYANPFVLQVPFEKFSDDIVSNMMFIDDGNFLRGDPSAVENRDARMVMVESFFLDTYEVTNRQYRQFLDDMAQPPSNEYMEYPDEPKYKRSLNGHRPKEWDKPAYRSWSPGERHPVVNVDWYDAYAYCRWRGKRLPTVLEWEKAAGWQEEEEKKYAYPWGNSFDRTKANTLEAWPDSRRRSTREVGSFEAGKSFYGLYDMAGNVLEWTDARYEPWLENGQYFMNVFENNEQTMQGGSFGQRGQLLSQTFWLFRSDMIAHDYHYGFRCALSAAD